MSIHIDFAFFTVLRDSSRLSVTQQIHGRSRFLITTDLTQIFPSNSHYFKLFDYILCTFRVHDTNHWFHLFFSFTVSFVLCLFKFHHPFFVRILLDRTGAPLCFVFVHNGLNKTTVIDMSHFFTVSAKSVIAAMFLFGMELVSLATFVTLFKSAANTIRSSFVCVITVLSVKLSITLITIDFCCHIGPKLGQVPFVFLQLIQFWPRQLWFSPVSLL